MTEWIEGSVGFSISTAQTMGTPVIQYQNTDDPPRARTVVDGYITIIMDTDDLCQVRLYGPVPGFASTGDFSFATPERNEALNWYWFNCGRGPLVFRVRSKRTFHELEELFMSCAKLRGSAATLINVGWQLLLSS